MPFTFHDIINELCKRLELEIPKDVSSDTESLKVGEHIICITLHPANFILMFCCIEYANIPESLELFQHNIFDESILKPILSREKKSNDWVLWNRQSINESTSESIYEQLEWLSDYADKLCVGDA